MTSSKGLEFNHVFIAAVQQGRLPYFSSRYRTAPWFEDRRKFYVSFAMARESVDVVYSGWYRAPCGVKRDGPSVFLLNRVCWRVPTARSHPTADFSSFWQTMNGRSCRETFGWAAEHISAQQRYSDRYHC